MVVYNPPGVNSLGAETVLWVPAIVSLTAMTAAEGGAVGVVNLSFALRGFAPGGDQGTSSDIRLGTKIAYQNLGRFAPTVDDWTYVTDPQAATGATTNKHVETLIEGAIGFIVDFRGLDATAFVLTAAQKYVVYPVQLGAQRQVAIDPTAEGGKFEIVQKLSVQSPGPTKGAVV